MLDRGRAGKGEAAENSIRFFCYFFPYFAACPLTPACFAIAFHFATCPRT